MDLTEGSETSAIINQTPGNYPKESLLHEVYLLFGTDDVFPSRLSYVGSSDQLFYWCFFRLLYRFWRKARRLRLQRDGELVSISVISVIAECVTGPSDV